jgi:pimeloyl-ACP methyl ester carboxylesterase
MPHATAERAKLYWAETGSAHSAPVPMIFVHEFGGDYRSWDDQMRHFGRGRRCITYSGRGYPGSDVPKDESDYGQDIATRDVIAVMDAAGLARAHVVGLSMGAYTALMVASKYPDRVVSCSAAGGGSGSVKEHRAQFISDAQASAAQMRAAGKINAAAIGVNPTRVQLQNKDPLGWATFVKHLGEHDPVGAACTLAKVQAQRPSLYDLIPQLTAIKAPTLLLVGDEDEPCLDVNLWMKRLMPNAQLALLPGAGHAINLEEPALFNQLIDTFVASVERGSWRPRDPRAAPGSKTASLGGGPRS